MPRNGCCLSPNLVHPRILFTFSFFYLHPHYPPRSIPVKLFSPMEPLSIFQLFAPRGEFYEPPPSSEPILTPGYEIRPEFISMVRGESFSSLDRENPYHHMREFEQLCSCLLIQGMTQETVNWKLFLFSLQKRAKQWYIYTVGSVSGSWNDLRDRFCLAFFPVTRITSLRVDVLSFQ